MLAFSQGRPQEFFQGGARKKCPPAGGYIYIYIYIYLRGGTIPGSGFSPLRTPMLLAYYTTLRKKKHQTLYLRVNLDKAGSDKLQEARTGDKKKSD